MLGFKDNDIYIFICLFLFVLFYRNYVKTKTREGNVGNMQAINNHGEVITFKDTTSPKTCTYCYDKDKTNDCVTCKQVFEKVFNPITSLEQFNIDMISLAYPQCDLGKDKPCPMAPDVSLLGGQVVAPSSSASVSTSPESTIQIQLVPAPTPKTGPTPQMIGPLNIEMKRMPGDTSIFSRFDEGYEPSKSGWKENTCAIKVTHEQVDPDKYEHNCDHTYPKTNWLSESENDQCKEHVTMKLNPRNSDEYAAASEKVDTIENEFFNAPIPEGDAFFEHIRNNQLKTLFFKDKDKKVGKLIRLPCMGEKNIVYDEIKRLWRKNERGLAQLCMSPDIMTEESYVNWIGRNGGKNGIVFNPENQASNVNMCYFRQPARYLQKKDCKIIYDQWLPYASTIKR